MRPIAIYLLTSLWAVWHCGWLFVSLFWFDNAAISNLAHVRIDFSQSESEVASDSIEDAVAELAIFSTTAPEADVTVRLNLPSEWFENSQVTVRIPQGSRTLTEARFPMKRIPEIGKSIDLEIQLVSITGPGKAELPRKHRLRVRNTEIPQSRVELEVVHAAAILQEPSGKSSPSDFAEYRVKVIPTRAATVNLSYFGNAVLLEDFQVVGEHVSGSGKQTTLSIPSSGSTTFRVVPLRNAAVKNAIPRDTSIQFAAAQTDKRLEVRIDPLKLQFANSDKLELTIRMQEDAVLSEGSPESKVALRIEGPANVTVPSQLKFEVSRSPTLEDTDYRFEWEPPTTDGRSVRLLLFANDDDKVEVEELLTLTFPDGDDYKIEGQRQFRIRLRDNDQKLIVTSIPVQIEGKKSIINLRREPPDSSPTPVQLVVSGEGKDRLAFLSPDGNAIPPISIVDDKASYALVAPSEVTLLVKDDQDFQPEQVVSLRFASDQTSKPQEQQLRIQDDDSQGDVLILLISTRYLYDQWGCGNEKKKPDPTIVTRFKEIRNLPNKHKLMSGRVLLVGRSKTKGPQYRFWNGDVNEGKEFVEKHAMIRQSNEDSCLIDAICAADHVVNQVLEKTGKLRADIHVVIIWPSDTDPVFEGACEESSLPKTSPVPPSHSLFIWMDGSGSRDVQLSQFTEFFRRKSKEVQSLTSELARYFADTGQDADQMSLRTVTDLPKDDPNGVQSIVSEFLSNPN